ncbi:ABC transporter ATP-binding protein [Lyngbya sp. PCC 8106]|uniref:ABC transporter ATP-binding protein n=1 Tax=Lyngbya sp. (strain PCC 8106) TaxID=313612 RepID=UPI0000EACDC7|nr:ABC transporter ATP-binding protein [Lyngbya sp. PCC 8106]EAW35515.1 ATP-binding protein of ABC transporter [Lyngbya sp. PCC 8106]
MNYLAKVLYILPGKKSSLILLVLSFLFVSLLEVFGLGIIGPFLSLSTNKNLIYDIPFLEGLYKKFEFQDEGTFIALIGLAIIVVFCVKSLISWRVQTEVFLFTYRKKGELTEKLMNAYLSAPYTFHLSQNSVNIIQNIITETKQFANGVLIPLLTCTSNCIIVFCLILLLGITNLTSIVVILGIIFPLFLFFNISKNKIGAWGKEASQSDKEVIRIINHSLGGIKETKLIGCEAHFESQIATQTERYTEACGKFYSYKLTPRLLVETLLVIFLVGFIAIFLLLKQDVQQLTATLGVFALASIRLIPAVSNIASGVSTLKNSSFTVNKLYCDLKEIEEITPQIEKKVLHSPEKKELKFQEKIILDRVRYCYPNSPADALKDICLTIDKGQSIAFIGKSGAGKTTLVDVILGLLVPQGGDIKVDTQSIYDDNNLRLWQNLIGYIPQSIFLIDDTIERNIAFGVPDDLIDQVRLKKAIEAAQLTQVIEALPGGLKTIVGERGVLLSGGQRQRVGIARALYHEREILVLDEATAALDNETEHLVTESIKSLSGTKTMIIIAHRLTTVEHCDCIHMMEKGQIVKSGTYHEVVLGEENSITTDR